MSYCRKIRSSDAVHGTAKLIIRTPNEIVAAADSLAVNASGMAFQEPESKIRSFGDFFISVNGMSSDPQTGYDIFALLESLGNESGHLHQKLAMFERQVQSQLKYTLEEMRKNDPDAYRHTVIEIAPLGVDFFGLFDSDLFLHNFRFVVRDPDGRDLLVDVEKHSCPGDCPDGIAWVSVGRPEYIQRLRNEFPDFSRAPLVHLAERYVQMQIDDGVPHVGPPVEVLRIAREGAQWIRKNQERE